MSNNLKRYRTEAGLTQTKVARGAGISVTWVARIEQSGLTPGQDVASKISKVLGRVADQVFPALHVPHAGASRFRQLQHVHPKPTAALTETERRLFQEILPLMPASLFSAMVGTEWKTVEEVVMGFVALVRKTKAGTWEYDVKGGRKLGREAVTSAAATSGAKAPGPAPKPPIPPPKAPVPVPRAAEKETKGRERGQAKK